ncbi:Hsp20/alpha crystallin family protein [Aestuariicoccus sp. MJ-SS9]|uniref:Hsp20/alpha crystallin family protein n=1 Tax=Aestuariicoccus sp. MJ-SS9 TaxID=3079855 RepID=UPI0029073F80|nr:Hsp20/alpha crystallin family protein [Aestuariicoccus sp. MJ-SS9]MDU8913377.1 Hsp20/alpha crystallin family protein [Aestuariicoccus sp. MJ-SS9]
MPKDDDKTPADTKATEAAKPEGRAGWGPLWSLRDEIDDLFEDFYRGGLAPLRRRWKGAMPALGALSPNLDVIDKEDELRITADLPGMAEKDIDIEVTDHNLTISGEKKEEKEEGDKEGDYYLSERRFGSFKRSIALPEGIEHDKIEATFANGVLTIRLPKTAEARQPGRKIEVKPGA